MEAYQQRILELRRTLEEHNRRYYVENAPSISDYEYDMLMNELISLEKSHPELITPDSPSRKVGSDIAPDDAPVKDFARLPHRYPMLSLGNTYNIGEVRDFVRRASNSLDDDGQSRLEYCCELKFDGTAICLTYRNGVLERALTRGDGTVGDDVTRNVRHIASIPGRLCGSGYPAEFEIRGEIYMPYKDFDRLCREKEEAGEEPFANPRNAASGSLKLTDSKQVAHRGLECTLYHMLGENLPYRTHDDALKAAASWGLPVSAHRRICRDVGEIEEFIRLWDTARKELPFATDGAVIKINDLSLQKELGFTSKFPKWAVAYKFKPEQACTPLLGIDYQTGRTGAVTPVANLKPVLLSGTIVKRATLHNDDQMKLLDIRIGDWVYVEKGGEIIPKITAVELSKRPPGALRPVFPTQCSDCGTPLVRVEGEAKWFCPNSWECPAQVKERLVQFMSRKAMNIIGGDAWTGRMYDMGLVRQSADLYSLTFKDLYRIEGWKDRQCERFLRSIEDSRRVSFDHVLFALGIRYIGETTAKTLARHFGNIDALMQASKDELLSVNDIGETNAQSVLDYFSEKRNLENLDRLRRAGLQFEMAAAGAKDALLKDLSIVITGTYSISRDEMKKMIEDHGGNASSSISGRTAYVIVGDNPGPEKVKKAGELGVKMLTEAEFYEITGEKHSKIEEKELTLF